MILIPLNHFARILELLELFAISFGRAQIADLDRLIKLAKPVARGVGVFLSGTRERMIVYELPPALARSDFVFRNMAEVDPGFFGPLVDHLLCVNEH